jgi:hypothetical protein
MILSQELVSVVNALKSQGIPYAVCGGFAVAIHGYPRMTFDLDVLVREDDLTNLAAAVKSIGFDVVAGTFAFRRGTSEETRFWRVSKFEGSDYLVLDVLLVTPILEEVWRSKERAIFDGHEIWAVSREGLAFMKKLSGRAKDLADLQNLGIIPHDEAEPEQL